MSRSHDKNIRQFHFEEIIGIKLNDVPLEHSGVVVKGIYLGNKSKEKTTTPETVITNSMALQFRM